MKKLKKLTALALCASMLFLSGCAQKPWDADVAAFDPATFTNEQMLADYDFFWSMLEENCPVLEPIARKQDLDLNDLKLSWRKDVAALKDGDAIGFAHIMSHPSDMFQRLGHVGAVAYTTYEPAMKNGLWESDTQRELYENPKAKAFYKWLLTTPDAVATMKSNAEKAEERKQNSNNDTQTNSSETPKKLFETIVKNSTPIIKLPTFNFTGDAQEKVISEIQQFCADYIDSKNIIIDIRGNGGGYSDVWIHGFGKLMQGRELKLTNVAALRDTEYNRKMWGKWYDDNAATVFKPISELYATDFIDASGVNRQDLHGCDKVAINQTMTIGSASDEMLFRGKIWLLTDSSNFSASELFVRICKQSNFATLIGERTKDGGTVVAPPAKIPFMLPNSGMLCQYMGFYAINSDGTCNEELGTPPDIEIGDGEDALEVCLAEIAK